MPAQNGAEDWHVPEKDYNPSLVRTFWYVAQCPMQNECSPKAWARCQCWSYISEGAVKKQIEQHLIKNNRHRIPEAEAAAIVESSCEVLTEQEEYDDRRQCRPRKRHSDYDCATA